ncbi:hypothetical protein ACIPYS_17825 [Kitasatospora sp. NPDC089913]|uniref:hypothetical protein n=1 Tax=Kitasatospora sp. NPDC089913 TaxID=3364080 RepID=UPI00381B3DA0
MLISALMRRPGRSLLLAELDETAQWGTAEHLLARMSDALEASNYLFIKANSSDTDDLPIPEPVPRPGVDHTELGTAESDFADGPGVADFFARMNSL